nr:MAG TPA: hypothetical protein [Caudoviricetes sp.]
MTFCERGGATKCCEKFSQGNCERSGVCSDAEVEK